MGKTIRLASVLLKCGLGDVGTDTRKKISGTTLISPVLFICLLPVMYYLFRGGVILEELFGSLDGEGLMLGFLMFVVSAFIFCTGIAACINSFYLSSNLNVLLPMPFTPGQITGAKFIVAAIYEYAISFTVLLPVLAGYGYAGHAPASFWIGTVLSVLVMPIVPLSYAGLVSMLVMRLIGGARNKERMTMLGAVGSFAILMLYELIQSATKGMKLSSVEMAVSHMVKMLRSATAVFPDIPYLARVMGKGEWISIVWSLFWVIIILAVFLFAARYLYLAGAVGMQDTSASHKKMTAKQMKRKNRSRNAVWSCTLKELYTILRTPAYYTSCLFLTLGWPLILILPALFSKAERSEAMILESLLVKSGFSVTSVFILFCIVFAVTVLAATLNGIAPSAISREGSSFYIMKQLPVSYRTQLRAKQNAALIVCTAGSGVYLLVGEIILIVLKGLSWWIVFPTILFNIPLLYIIVDLEMIYGLMKPRLVWESEGDVAAGNRIGFFLFLIGIVVGFVLIYGFYGWISKLSCGPWVFLAVLFGILGVIAFLINRIFYLYGERKLESL